MSSSCLHVCMLCIERYELMRYHLFDLFLILCNLDEDLTEMVLKKAAKAVGSLSNKEFNISFNPDLYQPKVTHADPESDSLSTDKAMLHELAEFVIFHQIPAFVSHIRQIQVHCGSIVVATLHYIVPFCLLQIQTCADHALSPVDGHTLTDALHARGINLRYLGRIAQLTKTMPTLSYLHVRMISVALLFTGSVLLPLTS